MGKLNKYIKNPKKIIAFVAGKGMLNWLPDEPYLKLCYWARMDKKLSLDNPQTFNEKLQWLKLHEHKPEYTKMVDKYEVKGYVAEKIGEEYIIPTYGVWDKFDDIDFNSLPDRFVLKCTHDSGGIVICSDKSNFNVDEARKKLNKCMKHNYYLLGREWPYKNVKPRIIAEKLISEKSEEEPKDYKFLCFDGKVKCIFTCSERFSNEGLKVTFYDLNWNRLPFTRHYPASEVEIEKPTQYEKMLQYSEILSKDIPFVRTDFYEIEGELFFGEITFYPGGGMEEFTPESWDYELGSWIKLPQRGGYTCTIDNICLWIHPEKYIESEYDLKDCKFLCFNGKPQMIF